MPTHPSLTQSDLPELIPVRDFVANTDSNGHYRISPDGKKLAWNGVSGLRSAILWRDLGSTQVQAHTFKKNAPRPRWAADSKHILYYYDRSGRENSHIYALNSDDASTRNLTPYPGVKAYLVHTPVKPSKQVYLMHNRRDRTIHDLYAVDVSTGEEILLLQNDDNIVNVLVDDDGNIRARVKQTEKLKLLQVPDNDNWSTLVSADLFDVIYPVGLSADGAHLFLISNVGRDKQALERFELATRKSTTVYEHATTDIGWALLSPRDRRLLIAYAEPDYPELVLFDDHFEKHLQPFIKNKPHGLRINSLDRNEQLATLSTWDHTGASHFLVNLADGSHELLGESSERKHAEVWVEPKPIEIKAGDGMRLYGYLTLPKVQQKTNLPTVLLVHGGPWGRDRWGYHTAVQFLANRGYAVLQVNYRGSRGYGRQYMYAGVQEFAGKMHQDLVDAVDWAISEGISDPSRIAIVGGSYGGYATLVGMTMTPNKFACGVDFVGVSDLASLIESAPPYWKKYLHMWHRFVGDPADPAQRQNMDARSPLNFADQTQGPLLILHGENDPRVKIDQSDRMVAALRNAGKAVDYVVIEDEGHGFGHWKNQLIFYRKLEDFLAPCLGGRSNGFDYYQLGSWAF